MRIAHTESAGSGANEALTWKDFSDFLDFYKARRFRKTGRIPRATTLRNKGGYLAHSSALTGSTEQVGLGIALADRGRTEYLLDALGATMGSGSMRNAVYALRDFGDFAVAKGWITSHTVRQDDIPPKSERRAIDIYTEAEVELLVSAARGKGLRWWALMATLADTGRRIGEVLALEWNWFRLTESPPYVALPWTKNGRPQYVPFGQRLTSEVFTQENILTLKHEDRTGTGHEFSRSPLDHPFPWTYGTVMNHMRRFTATVGVPYKGLHVFRHSNITHRLARGVPLHVVSILAGHSSISTTAGIYDHTDALAYWKYLDGGPGPEPQ